MEFTSPRCRQLSPGANPLGVVSLVFGSVALALLVVPCLGWVLAQYFAGIGILAGFVGLFLPRSKVSPATGLVLSLLAGFAGQALLQKVFERDDHPTVEKTTRGRADALGEVAGTGRVGHEKDNETPDLGQPDRAERWEDVSNRGRVGDVSFEVPWARPFEILGVQLGEGVNFGKMLVVKLKLTNTSTTRIVKFGGWQGEGTLEDEHGNRYSAAHFGRGFGGFLGEYQFDETPADKEYRKDCDTHAMIAANLTLHPGKNYITYLFYEEPAAVSKEARLTLPANSLGGRGELRLWVSIEAAEIERRQKQQEEVRRAQREKEEAAAIAKARRQKEEAAREKEEETARKKKETADSERVKREAAEQARVLEEKKIQEQREKEARTRAAHLRYAKELLDSYGEDGPQKRAKGAERLAWIVKEYPGSNEAREATKLLEHIKKDGGP